MAGFQPFPSPRSIRTISYWQYVDKRVARNNAFVIVASCFLLGGILSRYLLLRSTTTRGVGTYITFDHQNAPRPVTFNV